MARILRTTFVMDAAQAANGTPDFDLPVNPLSVILLTVKALNNGATPALFTAVTSLLAAITDVRLTYRGANIIQGSLTDLAVLYGCLARWMPFGLNQQSADNAVRAITVPLCLGRRPYDPSECFPATRRGDLNLQLSTNIVPSGLDALVIQAETIELLEAEPSQFIKATTTSKINNAVIEHDIEIPIANQILGLLLRGAVVPTADDYVASFGKVALQVDNVETSYSLTNWETLHGELVRKMGAWPGQPHKHSFIAAAVATEYLTREQETANALLDNYAYLDLDPLEDGSYALQTAGAARVNLRVTDEVGSASPIRVLPVELIQVAGGAAAA